VSAAVIAILLALLPPPSAFDDDFTGETMRLELYQVGDARDELVTLNRVYRDGAWAGPRSPLIDPFRYARYGVEVRDAETGRAIYRRWFDTMFGEYRTTGPAREGQKRVFQRALRVPWPRRPVLVEILRRESLDDRPHVPRVIFRTTIDPADYHAIREDPSAPGDWVYEAVKNGEPREKVDLVFVGEGYTAADRDKFKADVDRVAGWLFSYEPYRRLRGSFNVTGVLRPSPERAMDEPRQRVFKNTTLNASFNAFDTDRYMLVEENHALREIAAQVPYDTVVILVNSTRYGGGGIYEDYCVTTVDHARSQSVFIHEFGHSFAGLADEYYASDVAYNDFYPKGVEPLEPNITALLDPPNVKWKEQLTPGVPIPTPYGKEEREALQADFRKARQAKDEAAVKALTGKLTALDARFQGVRDVVGAFEGAGYASKGLYRPAWHCLMISSPKDEFCPVCQAAIERMIRYYEGSQVAEK
jgi:hypothetical protein